MDIYEARKNAFVPSASSRRASRYRDAGDSQESGLMRTRRLLEIAAGEGRNLFCHYENNSRGQLPVPPLLHTPYTRALHERIHARTI